MQRSWRAVNGVTGVFSSSSTHDTEHTLLNHSRNGVYIDSRYQMCTYPYIIFRGTLPAAAPY